MVIEILDFDKIKRSKGKRKIKETYNRESVYRNLMSKRKSQERRDEHDRSF